MGTDITQREKRSSYEINRSFTPLKFFCKPLWEFIGEELKENPKKVLISLFLFIKKNKSNKEQKFLKSKPLSTKHFVRPKLRKFDLVRKNFPSGIFVDKAFWRFSNVAWPETFFVLIHCKCLTNSAMIIMTLGLCNRKNIRAEERLKNKNF